MVASRSHTKQATASAFAHLPYAQQRSHELLSRLSDDLFVLKIQAQERLPEHGLRADDVRTARDDIATFLRDLMEQASSMVGSATGPGFNVSFMGIADRFVRLNPNDVPDRIAELGILQDLLLQSEQSLPSRDFRLLDRLQTLLEEETAESVRSLYRF